MCVLESFITNISHHFFYFKITFVNSQHENTNSNSDSVPLFERFVVYKIIDLSQNIY